MSTVPPTNCIVFSSGSPCVRLLYIISAFIFAVPTCKEDVKVAVATPCMVLAVYIFVGSPCIVILPSPTAPESVVNLTSTPSGAGVLNLSSLTTAVNFAVLSPFAAIFGLSIDKLMETFAGKEPTLIVEMLDGSLSV
ncbi:MAG: hypothetical protein DDT19_01164 [Syntrophomonadaceae bacterium]|nr:hypothetical protein [Bacillota bacterium]